MNETRKQIIGLIEPYTEKKLVSWCYIEYEDYIIWKGSVMKIYKMWDKHNNLYCWWIKWEEIEFYTYSEYDTTEILEVIEIKKILWHYDITAVEKLLIHKGCNVIIIDSFVKIYHLKLGTRKYIPNKPLHLYTEQEEKDLLKLLLKLK